METLSPGLAAHKGSRGQVLVELKHDQPLTAQELADRLGVSATAARRHLKELEAEQLVIYGREQRGHGAPTYVYRLSEKGEDLFPNSYQDTARRLLEHMIRTEGRSAAAAVLKEQYADLRKQLAGRVEGLEPEERVVEVARVLNQAGYMAEASSKSGSPKLLVHNCAIHALASCLPEICEAEIEFIQESIGAPVKREAHIVSGCNACEYAVHIESKSTADSNESRQER